MKYNRLVILFLLVNLCNSVYSQHFLLNKEQKKKKKQEEPMFLKKKGSAPKVENAEYKKNFSEGSFLMLEENYPMALKKILTAYQIDPSNANVNYKLGLCYLKSISHKQKAIKPLELAALNVSEKYVDMDPSERKAPVNAYYYLGIAYHLIYRFDEAIANFEKFKSFISPKQKDIITDVNNQIAMCDNAKRIVGAPLNVIVTNLGDSVNSPYPDYGPVISADESMLIFTSRKPGSTGGDKTPDNQFYEDIYICYKKADGTWSSPSSISSNVNTYGNEAAIGLSADGQQLFIYRDDYGDGNIYMSMMDGYSWTIPVKMGSDINTKAWEPSACISADGNTLYFVSDRKGGIGGRDIWKCVKLPNGQWSLASNLGPSINTPKDEDAPFIHPDGITLFFSSNGHKTIGGFDIFFSAKNPENSWEEPINIGYPVNTTGDDIFYVTSPDGKRGYYSSAKNVGYGEKDIYMITSPEATEIPLTLIKGVIILPQGQQLPDDIEIVVTNNETGANEGRFHPIKRNGSFTLIIPPNSNYKVSYNVGDTEFYSEDIFVPADAAYKEIDKAIELKPVVLEKKN